MYLFVSDAGSGGVWLVILLFHILGSAQPLYTDMFVSILVSQCAGARTFLGAVIFVYRGSIHQSLYTCTVEPGTSLASEELWRQNQKIRP